MSSAFDIIIRSSDRVRGTPNNYTVSLPQDLGLQKWKYFYCSSVTMRGSRYNIHHNNNRLYCVIVGLTDAETIASPDIDLTPVVAVVPVGNYSRDQLADAIELAIKDAHFALFPTGTALQVKMIHNDTTSKYTLNLLSIEHAGASTSVYTPPNARDSFFTLCDGSALFAAQYTADGNTYENSLNSLLGFSDTSSQYNSFVGGGTYQAFHIANYPHRFEHIPALLLECNFANYAAATSSVDKRPAQILAMVTEPSYGVYGVWESGDAPSNMYWVNARQFGDVEFRWLDEKGDPAEFNGVDHILTLRFLHKLTEVV